MTANYLSTTSSGAFNLQTDERTIGGTAVDAQVILTGESAMPTYTAIASNIVLTTANAHLLQIMGDGTNYCRLRSVSLAQSTLSGAVNTAMIAIYRLSTAGTGGSAVSSYPFDAADTSPYGGGAMTLPTVKGTEGTLLYQFRLGVTATNPMNSNDQLLWVPTDDQKPIIWGTSIANGIAFKIVGNVATAAVDCIVTFTLSTYL